jgi:hypothetical protein
MNKEDLKNISEIVKAVPIYEDAIQPAAKELGKALTAVAKTINIALAPIKLMVWGYDQIEVFLTNRLTEKLKDIPEENIITPPTYLAGPAIEALRYSGHNEELRELYANLLATSMDRSSSNKAHPGYVEIIKNLTPNEARLLKIFVKEKVFPLINIISKEEVGDILLVANYTLLNEYLHLDSELTICTYITNLCRLGIFEVPYGTHLADEDRYKTLENSELVNYATKLVEGKGKSIKLDRGLIRLTSYGEDFIKCVVRNENE